MENIGEKSLYVAKLCGQTVVSIKEYTEESPINKISKNNYVMSVAYLGANKRAIVFLLTSKGFIVGKIYEYSVAQRKYRLINQTLPLDSSDVLFDQFENDCKHSPYLKAVDFDECANGKRISKRFKGINPSKAHPSVLKDFEDIRNNLSYNQKLSQQLGRRKDPIENILMVFHQWKKVVDICTEFRGEQEKQELKRQKYTREFNEEDELDTCLLELDKIRVELKKGVSTDRLHKINKRISELKKPIMKMNIVSMNIDFLLKSIEPELEDTGLMEL